MILCVVFYVISSEVASNSLIPTLTPPNPIIELLNFIMNIHWILVQKIKASIKDIWGTTEKIITGIWILDNIREQ